MHFRIWLILAPTLALAAGPAWAQTSAKPAPPVSLADALKDARAPLVVLGGKFSGAGADVLTQAVAQSRFVLVGEDHITREIPQLVSVLCDAMHPDAYAVEAGPGAAQFVSGLLHQSDRIAKMAERGKAYPNNMAFLDIREENDLAAHCAAAGGANFQLLGLDQEFVGSAGVLLKAMEATHPGPKSLAAIAATETLEQAAEKATRTSGDPGKLFLLAATDADTQPLADSVAADGNDETRRIWSEFAASRAIYRLNAEGSPDSNRVRSLLMKQHFMADYANLTSQNDAPRVLFKFGEFHLYKGFNPLHQLDIGDFVAELADFEQAKSLHIMILGAHGTHAVFGGYARPLGHETFVMADDPEYKWLAPAVANLLPQPAGGAGQTLTVFDLRKLRLKGIDMPADWDRVVDGYDLFVLIPELTPASAIE